MIPVRRHVAARGDAVWAVLTDTTLWPVWGPTVRAVELTDGGTRIGPGSTGRVGTATGIWLPFEVTDWDEGRRWAWRVAGIPATGHAVEEDPETPSRSRVTIEVPAWAPFYAAVGWIALGRIGRLASSS
jgi:hypothetical protein